MPESALAPLRSPVFRMPWVTGLAANTTFHTGDAPPIVTRHLLER
ncbi:MAG TPA: hypothetical protein VMZ74_12825 [Ramlibacter sp.]|nr:hypothetical protein [Ramlibacter sp.]